MQGSRYGFRLQAVVEEVERLLGFHVCIMRYLVAFSIRRDAATS